MNEATSDLAMWTALVAFLMPPLVAVVQQPRWQPRTRALVAAVASIVAGAGTVYFTTPSLLDDGTAMTTVILTVLMASTAAYRAFWKPVGIRTLESATSPGDDTIEHEEAAKAERDAEAGLGVTRLSGEPEEGAAIAGERESTESRPSAVRDEPRAVRDNPQA